MTEATLQKLRRLQDRLRDHTLLSWIELSRAFVPIEQADINHPVVRQMTSHETGDFEVLQGRDGGWQVELSRKNQIEFSLLVLHSTYGRCYT